MFRKLLLMGLLIAAAAYAQRGGGGMGGDMGEGGGGGSRNGGLDIPSVGPARMTRLDLLTQMLSLNKDQKKEVKTIMDDGSKAAAPLRDQLTKSRAEIAAAIQAGKGQAEIDQAVKNYSAVEAQMADLEMKAFAKMYKALDQEQKSKTRNVFLMMSGIFRGKNWNEM